MRLFKTNKSQASLQSSHDGRTQSQEQSPVEPALAPHSQQQQHLPSGGGQSQTTRTAIQTDGASDPPPYQSPVQQQYQRYDEGGYNHPGLPGRSQSQRISPTTYTNPTVKLVGPGQGGLDQATAINEADQRQQQFYSSPPLNSSAQFGDLPDVPKHRRGFFGLSSALVKDKNHNSGGPPQQPPQKLGRSISVRRKQDLPPQPNPNRFSVQDPSSEIRTLREENEEEFQRQQNIIPPLRSPQLPYERSSGLYQQPQQELSNEQLALNRVNTDSSIERQLYLRRSENETHFAQQSSHHPAHYTEEIHQPISQNPQYQDYPPPPTKTSSSRESYQIPPNLQIRHNPQFDRIRPPSQQSLGPPSPLSQQTSFELPRHGQVFQSPNPVQAHTQVQRDAQSHAQIQRETQTHQAQGQRETQNQARIQRETPGQLQREGQEFNRNSVLNFPTPLPPGSRDSMPPSSQNNQMRGMPGQQPPPRTESMPDQSRNHGGQYSQGTGPPQGGNNRHLQQSQEQSQGRHSPQPKSRGNSGDNHDIDVDSLLQKHDELQAKYSKVKKYYFEKDSQVQQLQNTLAHQRLSLSRTSLDDNEYATRFSRLDGAINNLAFNIRKDWKAIPPWLQGVVNRDAMTVGTKEMTAVGRACISRWLVDEIIDRYFHPGLEPALSSQLKIIEKNVRRFAPPTNTDEERDSALAKISNWRLTTLDGLADMLSSTQAAENRANLTNMLVEKLVASLQMNLKDPPPPGLEGSVTMIVELAVGLSANLPQESREVCVEYAMPGCPINETFMKVESTIPPLSNPCQPFPTDQTSDNLSAGTDHSSTKSGGETSSLPDTTSSKDASLDQLDNDPRSEQRMHDKSSKRSMLGGLMSKKPPLQGGMSGQQSEKDSRSGSISGQGALGSQGQGKDKEDDGKAGRVRFSAFLSVEVKGKGQVLCKAPIYGF